MQSKVCGWLPEPPKPTSGTLIEPSSNPRQCRSAGAFTGQPMTSRNVACRNPILVRPITSPDAKFELVFGERRYLAPQKAGAPTIRVMKRDLSDEKAEDLQISIYLWSAKADQHVVYM
jgi:ParB/RepB/Spo0J family partition protein